MVKNKQSMPEGPEVKIASDYFNEFFAASKKIEFELEDEIKDKLFRAFKNNQ